MKKRDIRSVQQEEETTEPLRLISYCGDPDEIEKRILIFIFKTAASTLVLTETTDSQLKSFRLY